MYKICFALPYYNHPNTIKELVRILEQYHLHIVIVDDGSDENAKEALRNLNATILTHATNRGKGAAVKTAMNWALENNFTHIFQIDSDMQHDVSVIPNMLELSLKNQKSLICGYGKYDSSIPKSRLYGRKITDFWVYVNTFGAKFKDVMTGIRIYPLSNVIITKTKSNRMEFDIEVMMNYYKLGIEILWIEVAVKYGQSPSHFRAFKDNVLISKMQAKAFCALPFYLYKRFRNVK